MKVLLLGFFVPSIILFSMCSEKKVTGIQGEEIDYSDNEVVMKGYLAYDASQEGKQPGILVVHEWWGINEYAHRRARMLAELGYTALAIDMYGQGKQANHPEDASKFATEVMQHMDIAKARFQAALKLLKSEETVDTSKIAAIGYCFGGGIVLQMARLGLDLNGVVSFHGSLATNNPAQPGKVKAKLLVCNGGDDPLTTPEQISAFKKEMDNAGVDYQFISYPGAKHSFTNPKADTLGAKFNMPIAYNQNADEKSWQDMIQFFNKLFAQ